MRQDSVRAWIDAGMCHRPLRQVLLKDKEFSGTYFQETLHAYPHLPPSFRSDADSLQSGTSASIQERQRGLG